MTGAIDPTSAELGSLRASVEHLANTIQTMATQWREQETTASNGRRALREKVETSNINVGLQIAGLSLRVDRLTDQVKLYEPSVTAFKEEKLREEGAKRLGAWMIAGMMGFASAVGWGLHEFFLYLRH